MKQRICETRQSITRMVSTRDLKKVTKFCSTVAKSAPSPPLQPGELYCLSGFAGRAAQWYKEEVRRQTTLRYREASSAGTRRQPSRTAKDKFYTCDYVLLRSEVDALFRKQADVEEEEDSTSESSSSSPSEDQEPANVQGWEPEASLEDFQTRLGIAVQMKIRELRSRYDPEGIKHRCTMVHTTWACVDEEYCGHGLVNKCLKWVPKKVEHLRPRMKVDMEDFFSAKTANNQPERLKELKKNRCSTLKKTTLEKLAALEAAVGSQPEAMMEAEMLESPTLGRWPNTPGFLVEEIEAQTVEFAGLTFAVDVCLGEPRILMLYGP